MVKDCSAEKTSIPPLQKGEVSLRCLEECEEKNASQTVFR